MMLKSELPCGRDRRASLLPLQFEMSELFFTTNPSLPLYILPGYLSFVSSSYTRKLTSIRIWI